jgi:hypothetical protein
MSTYDSDPLALDLLHRLTVYPDAASPFQMKDGLIRPNCRVWLPDVPQLQHHIILALHASPTGGHSRVPVNLRRIK